jgi:hypothetical protein
MVNVSLTVGMNGWVAMNESVVGLSTLQVPLTGGSSDSAPRGTETGDEKCTLTTWLEGTFAAPAAGSVESTCSGLGLVAAVIPPAELPLPACPEPALCRAIA